MSLSTLKTENQINADIKSVLENALMYCGIRDWSVMQSNPPQMQGLIDKVVRFLVVSVNRDGWQGNNERVEEISGGTSSVIHREKFREIRRVQIDFFRKRLIVDNELTITADDVARKVLTYLDGSAGIQALREKGYNKLRTDSIRIGYGLNDSDLYQMTPGFDLMLIYDQAEDTLIGDAYFDGFKAYPV